MRKWLGFLILWLFTISPLYAAIDPASLLSPEQAFKLKVEAVGTDKIKATWDIADGYYLYRERFGFEAKDVTLEAPKFPTGDSKEDENFGKIEVYHKQVVVEIPVKRDNQNQPLSINLTSKFQGCADAGVCYNPLKQSDTVELAAAQVAPTPPPTDPLPTKADQPNSLLKNIGSSTPNAPLSAEEAFVFTLVAIDKGNLNAHWIIKPDHHLYKPKIKFKVLEPQTVTIGKIKFPDGEKVDDEYFGKIEIFGKDIDVKVPLLNTKGVDKVVIETEYQGCADKSGVCYEPQIKTETLSLSKLPEARAVATGSTKNKPVQLSEQDQFIQKFEDRSFFGKIVMMFGAGLLLAFTPCIFPMIPILSGIIAGSGYGNTSSRKAFWLSLIYVLSGALTYALIGFVFGYFGQNLQTVLQHPATFIFMTVLFVALALSMFGFYDLQLPNSIQSRLSEISNRQESGSFIGAAIMGVLSTLIVGPCAGPVLAGTLIFIAQNKDYVLGATALFSMGLGTGLPLLLIGTSAGHLLPRAGAWMDTVKAVFGIIMLGVAIMILDRIVEPSVTMALTGILLVVSGVYMGALDKLDHDSAGWHRFWKSLGMIQLFYGTMLLLGVAAGSQNIWQPLKGIVGVNVTTAEASSATQQAGLQFKQITGLDDLNQTLAEAKQAKRPVMLDFYADWCTTCHDLEKHTFTDAKVNSLLKDAILIQADVTENTEAFGALKQQLSIVGPPTIVFFTPDGEEAKAFRIIGAPEAKDFADHISKFLASF